MNSLAYILAADDLGWVELVVIALFFGISIIGSIFQKLMEKKKKADADKPAPAKKTRPAQSQRQTQIQPPAQKPAPPAARPQGQPAGRKQTLIQLQTTESKPVRVSEELRLRQQRELKLERERQKRLATRTPPEADAREIQARIARDTIQDSAPAAPLPISQIGIVMSLESRDEAQRAMILHEVFSQPKALRQGGEMWDT